jgi:hypothetical protein
MPQTANHEITIEALQRHCLRISENGDDRAARLHTHRSETVRWYCDDPATFSFPYGNPFQNDVLPVRDPRTGYTQILTIDSATTKALGAYKYDLTVTAETGDITEDPQVIIDKGTNTFIKILLGLLAGLGLGVMGFLAKRKAEE